MDIKEARFRAGLSQYDIALKTGIPQSKLSLGERGYLNFNEVEKKKIAKVLNCKPHDLFLQSVEAHKK